MKYISTYDYVEKWGRFYIPIVVENNGAKENNIGSKVVFTTLRYALTHDMKDWVYKHGPSLDNETTENGDNTLPSPLDTKLGKALYEI